MSDRVFGEGMPIQPVRYESYPGSTDNGNPRPAWVAGLSRAGVEPDTITLSEMMPGRVGRDTVIPAHEEWKINADVATASNEHAAFISIDPNVIAKVQKLNSSKENGLVKFLQSDNDVMAWTKSLSGTFLAGYCAYKLSGGDFWWTFWGAATGDASVYAIGGPGQKKIAAYMTRRANNAFFSTVTRSHDTVVIPNKSAFTENVGIQATQIIEESENPREVLFSKIAPVVKMIFAAEVQIAATTAELTSTVKRTETLGKQIEEDQLYIEQLVSKKPQLITTINAGRKELEVIRQEERKRRRFSGAITTFKTIETTTHSTLLEFTQEISSILQSAYVPKMTDVLVEAIGDWMALLETLSTPDLLRPVYDVFAKKYQKKGLPLPDYEWVETQIAQKRDLR